MEIFVLTFVVFALAAVGMAAGLLLRGSALAGSCATITGDGDPTSKCDICRASRSEGEA